MGDSGWQRLLGRLTRAAGQWRGLNDGLRPGHLFRILSLFLFLLLLLLVVFLVVYQRSSIFTINATTEILVFSVDDPVLSEWEVGGARLIDDPLSEDQSGRLLGEYTTITLQPGTRVEVQRHGSGPVRLRLTSAGAASVGRLELAEGRGVELGSWALLKMHALSTPVVLPFRGRVIVGDDVSVGVNSILLSGSISIVEEQLLGNTRYIAGVEKLDPGDRVQLRQQHRESAGGDSPVVAEGFMRIEPVEGFSGSSNALSVIAHGQADYVQVERLGSSGYRIHTPFWSRLLHDPLLLALAAVLALLATLFELWSKLAGPLPKASHDGQAPEGCREPRGKHKTKGSDD